MARRLALLSVSNKTGIVELGKALVDRFDFDIISSGGTAKTLQAGGVPVMKVSDYTGFPEILGGRVKTLHPRVHGGILANRDLDDHHADLEANEIRPIDLVAVNLYPFEATIAQPDVTLADAVENIDIGGPAMLRAAAKNFKHLTVLCNPAQYETYLAEMAANKGVPSFTFRRDCAKAGFWHTCTYDRAIATYLNQQSADLDAEAATLPDNYAIAGEQIQALRYGENPHQPASWYQVGKDAIGWGTAEKLQGKALSYNNLVDLEAARRIIAEFLNDKLAAVAVLKHTNPCGIALGETLVEAYTNAFEADSLSAFGGIVALNRSIDADTATAMTKTFLECIIAPGCDDDAREILAAKKNLRVLILPDLATGPQETVKAIAGGFLVQVADDVIEQTADWNIVTEKQPTEAELAELLFAWKACKYVKSNAIVITKNRVTVGVGAGQMNRVGAAKIALEQAGDLTQGATLASDGFFPFDDSVRSAAAAGITAIVQPGGSIRDDDSIAAANELGLVMVFTGMRHFLH